MKRTFPIIVAILLSTALSCSAAEPLKTGMVHHDINVRLEPERSMLTVEDSITLPPGRPAEMRFQLHEGLEPITPSPGVRIEYETTYIGQVTVESFRLTLPPGRNTFVMRYSGNVSHPLASVGKETARGFSTTPGTISGEGIFLAGSSSWYAQFGGEMVTFTLEASLPPGWDAVSQGKRAIHSRRKEISYVRWESLEPQDEMYLVAAPFTEYTKPAGRTQAMVFLREPDQKLAEKYLDATARYLSLYENMIGPYPYAKFALVENFWETGYGMPSFTLLGPTVVRLPFIINTSYPHEILHNWWGNSVYPDYAGGNWSEGLTAYLSDHLTREQQGQAVEYRQTTLQKYADYVLEGRDFPLTRFQSRHSSPSEAIGYGKSLMFFHMLRIELGDGIFIAALQDFYRNYRFKTVSFEDLRKSFEKSSGRKLAGIFEQWVARAGAPEIRLSRVKARMRGKYHILTARIEQVQKGPVYRLRVPVAVTMDGMKKAHQAVFEMDKRKLDFSLDLPSRPLRIDVDPEFDLFRRLSRNEIPPAITQAFGAKRLLVILPSSASGALLSAYRQLGDALSRSGPDETIVKLDSEMQELPSDRSIAILGWENQYAPGAFSTLSGYDVSSDREHVNINRTTISKKDHAFVFTARHGKNNDLAKLFIASDKAEALPGLGRKLPHYHKYSYLAFQGTAPENIAKGRWQITNSPLTAFVPDAQGAVISVEMADLAQRPPLAALPQAFSKERMTETILFLADQDMRGRGLGTPELHKAAELIAKGFAEAGLTPGSGNGSWFHEWQERTGEKNETVTLRNVIGIIPGMKPELAGQSVVIGAHYDHLGLGWPDVRKENKGKVHPGADDNASGTAILLELARFFSKQPKLERTLVFVAFTGEEAGKLGSKRYVSDFHPYPAKRIIGMINLDTVGRMEKNRLLVLGGRSAREWVHIFRGAGFVTGVDVQVLAEDLDSSDQGSFHEAGVPAIQLFTGPHTDYHRPSDRPEKIAADGLVKVASVAKEAIEYLAARPDPLTSTISTGTPNASSPGKERKISLGTIPDFAFAGPGVRLAGIVPGSSAEAAGLQEGDVIIRINKALVTTLKDLSNILKELKPSDSITVTYLRQGSEMRASVTAQEK
ncbi:MAG: hypothetical protein A2X56_08260 [Nitrospirae bacterium GWC2_57_13]|nr:MAG: hypothetical protein A2X56_08260 [Nitrospirae bacterium GWC2_57_13]